MPVNRKVQHQVEAPHPHIHVGGLQHLLPGGGGGRGGLMLLLTSDMRRDLRGDHSSLMPFVRTN
eukprot:799599-Prorocentrum_minimum.AAC.2